MLEFEEYLLDLTQAKACEEVEVIQSLWSGYGKISRYQLHGSERKTVVVKCISLLTPSDHPRGWNTNLSHQRKVKSYEVETNWYRHWSHRCSSECKIPQFIASFQEGQQQWIVLEDLQAEYPLQLQQVTFDEVKLGLKWLAHFHAKFMHADPSGLWEVGTYWHLATRPDEFELIENQNLKSKAHVIDQKLNDCQFKTLVHGDAKLANFCFSKNRDRIAAVDFQYVGGGCGMKDLTYFVGSCLTGSECEAHEAAILEYYFTELESALQHVGTDLNFSALEEEWRAMYPLAHTDFMRFLLGWMPSHQKINAYNQRLMNEVLLGL